MPAPGTVQTADVTYGHALPDEAVIAHDLARVLPERAWDELIDGLVADLSRGATCVDVGIGTGAIGGRLAGRDVAVVGIDINASMLAHLHRRHPTVPLCVGDATSLPCASGVADLVVLACVLHLVDQWRAALAEPVRVAFPGARIALNLGTSALAGRSGVGRRFLEAVKSRVDLSPMPGPAGYDEVTAFLTDTLGCTAEERLSATAETPRSVADHIFRLEWNPFGWPPGTPQWALSEAAEETRAWAQSTWGDIEERVPTEVSMGFLVFRTAPVS